jgi:hypothetical protein
VVGRPGRIASVADYSGLWLRGLRAGRIPRERLIERIEQDCHACSGAEATKPRPLCVAHLAEGCSGHLLRMTLQVVTKFHQTRSRYSAPGLRVLLDGEAAHICIAYVAATLALRGLGGLRPAPGVEPFRCLLRRLGERSRSGR